MRVDSGGTPAASAGELEAGIRGIEKDIVCTLAEVTGTTAKELAE